MHIQPPVCIHTLTKVYVSCKLAQIYMLYIYIPLYILQIIVQYLYSKYIVVYSINDTYLIYVYIYYYMYSTIYE
jgi:hypothetical protein